ncbi:MAG: hypothetical protein AABY26_00595 [Nanoarchaeota archaeon]
MKLPRYFPQLLSAIGTMSITSLMLAATPEVNSPEKRIPPRKIVAEVMASSFYNLYQEPLPRKADAPECAYFTVLSTWNYEKSIRLDTSQEQVSGTAALTGEIIYTAPAKYTKAARVFGFCDNSQKDVFDELAVTMEQDALERIIVENPVLGVYECMEKKTPPEQTAALRRDYLENSCQTLSRFSSSRCVEIKTKLEGVKKDYTGYVCQRLELDRSPITPEENPEMPEDVPGC